MMMYFSILKPDDDKINSLAADDVYELVDDSIEKVLHKMSKKITAFNTNSRNRYLMRKIQRTLKRTAAK